jgi:hypothetical protein
MAESQAPDSEEAAARSPAFSASEEDEVSNPSNWCVFRGSSQLFWILGFGGIGSFNRARQTATPSVTTGSSGESMFKGRMSETRPSQAYEDDIKAGRARDWALLTPIPPWSTGRLACFQHTSEMLAFITDSRDARTSRSYSHSICER